MKKIAVLIILQLLCFTYIKAQLIPEVEAPNPDPIDIPTVDTIEFYTIQDLNQRDLSLPVYQIPHEVSVSPLGSTTIHIPIDLPIGAGGFKPNLGFQYDSQSSSSGILGVGWGVSGLSIISRGPKIMFHDGFVSPLMSDPSAFYVDGQRLLRTNVFTNENGKTWGLFEKDIYDHNIIEGEFAFGPNGQLNLNNPISFRIKTRDGLTYEYGIISNNQSQFTWDIFMNNNNTRHSFYLSKVTDKHGNFYEILYTKPLHVNSTPHIDKIRYGGNSAKNTDALYEIVFTYGRKTNPMQREISDFNYVHDELLITQIRITSIADEEYYKTYLVRYSKHEEKYYISQFELENNGSLIGKLLFSVVQPVNQISLSTSNEPVYSGELEFFATPSYESHPKSYTFYNSNVVNQNNGKVYARIKGLRYTPADNGGFYNQQIVDPPLNSISMQNIIYDENVSFALHSAINNKPFNAIASNNVLDLYRDGKTHTILAQGTTNSTNGIITDYTISALTPFEIENRVLKPNLSLLPGVTKVLNPKKGGVFNGDIDGNGQPEILTFFYYNFVTNSGIHNLGSFNPLMVSVYLNGSQLYFPVQIVQHSQSTKAEWKYFHEADIIAIVDVDGDGKSEILTCGFNDGLRIYGTTSSQASPHQFSLQLISKNEDIRISTVNKESPQINFGDINKDGLPDIAVSIALGNIQNWKFYLGTGRTFSEVDMHQASIFPKTYDLRLVDITGDGKSEIVTLSDHVGYKFLQVHSILGIEGEHITGAKSKIILSPNYFQQTISGAIIYISSITALHGNSTQQVHVISTNSQALNRTRLILSKAVLPLADPNFAEGLINGIADHSGITHKFQYGALTKPNTHFSFYTLTSNQYTGNYLGLYTSTLVVRKFEKRTNNGTFKTFDYSYRDLIGNKQGKGLLGFKSYSIHTDVQPNVTEVQFFNHNLDIAKSLLTPLSVQTFRNSTPVSSTLKNYSITTRTSGAIVLNLIEETEINNLSNHQKVTTYLNYTNSGVPLVTEQNTGSGLEIIRREFQYVNQEFPHLPTSITTYTKRQNTTFDTTVQLNSYNAKGDLHVKTKHPNSTLQHTTTCTYNDFGLLTSYNESGSGQNRSTQFEYDPTNRFVILSTGPAGEQEHAHYNLNNGKIASWTKSDSTKFEYHYDDTEIMTNQVLPSGRTITSARTWITNESGILFKEEINETARPKITRWYDYSGKLVKEATQINYISHHNFQEKVVTWTYDSNGRLISQSDPYLSRNNQPEEAISVTHINYDEFDRVFSNSHPINGTITYNYSIVNGNYIIREDLPNGKFKETEIDRSGKTIHVRDNNGTISTNYNSLLLPSEIRQNNVIVSSFEYDKNRKKTKHLEANAGLIEYTYNSFEELTSTRDSRNQTEVVSYDLLGRIASKSVAGITTNYEYYPQNNGRGKALKLKKISVSSDNYQEYDYDNHGRLISKNIKFPGEQLITSTYTYLPNDLISTENLNITNSTLSYTYSAIGELRNIVQNSSVVLYRLNKVNALGQELNSQLAHFTITRTNTYENGKPTSQLTTRLGQTLAHLQYNWNQSTGNLSSRSDLRSSVTNENFTYDVAERLTQTSVNNVPLGINYSSNGNIVYKQGIGHFSYETPKIHALSKSSPVGQQGSPQTIPPFQQTVIYDDLSRPQSISENGFNIVFAFGADGERFKSTLTYQGAHVETRLYADNYEKIIKNGQTWHIQYIKGLNELVALRVIENNSEQVHYVVTDHLGSIIRTVLSDGSITAEQNFDAWGRRRNPNTWNYANVGSRPAWLIRGFTGHEHLDVFNIIHMNARLYDPLVSRMLSPDKYVVDYDATQAYNRYSYCLNNPLKYVDPDGNLAITATAIAVAAVVGGGFNVMSNWSNIKKDPWSSVSYFTSGALGGALSLVNPAAGGSLTATMNVITDVAFGNVPKIENPLDGITYFGLKALDGLNAAGAGYIGRGASNLLSKKATWFSQAFGSGQSVKMAAKPTIENVAWQMDGLMFELVETKITYLDDIVSTAASKGGTQGGLNLFKSQAAQTTQPFGWKTGDYMLHLPNKGTPQLNWKANYGALRREMGLGKPIFDSYRHTNGNLIPTRGFLNAERSILQGRGWIYNAGSGAWLPPGF